MTTTTSYKIEEIWMVKSLDNGNCYDNTYTDIYNTNSYQYSGIIFEDSETSLYHL